MASDSIERSPGITYEDLMRLYGEALDEIYVLRRALAYEAGVIEVLLEYKTFPKSRRPITERQIERMRASARGEADPYAGLPWNSLSSALSSAGASGTLTRYQWEEQLKARTPTRGSQ